MNGPAIEACRPAAPAQAPRQCEAGNQVKRDFRGEFRQRVLVTARQHRCFEPRDGCRIESAATRRVLERARAEADLRRAAPAPSGRQASSLTHTAYYIPPLLNLIQPLVQFDRRPPRISDE